MNHFGILVGVRKYRILIVLCKKSFFELPNHISRLTSQNEVSASFFFLLLRLLEKIGSYRVLLFYTLFSLHFNKTKKKINCFIYISLAKHCWVIKLGNLKVKNTFPDKLENPESLKKWSRQFEYFLTNVPIVSEDLVRAF